MNVYLIKASAPGPFKDYKKATGGPSQNIFSVAAATPKGVNVEMCDETIGMKIKRKVKADIVAIFFHTPDALHAYKLADGFRAKGTTVILGGLHASFMPDEAGCHADSLLIGEAEGIWSQLLDDWSNGQLQKRYQRENPVDLAELAPYPTDIIPPSKYEYLWSVVVSRGCPHQCTYCTVPPFFKGKYRVRPIENIIAEIKAAPTDWFELHADNLTANRQYALDLFAALTPLKINWYGEATIKMADDPELLLAAAKSGCRELLIGIETPSQAALNETGKGFVAPEQIKEKIDRFHEVGIQVSSSMIFGFDTHSKDIFTESEEFCRFISLDEVEGVLLIPFPGTPLYAKLEKEGRILTSDWSKYDGSNVVFNPTGMSVRELEEGSYWFWETLQKNKEIRTTSSTSPWTFKEPNNKEASTENLALRDEREQNGSRLFTGFRTLKWKALLGLALIFIGFVMDWYWVWGILFLTWAIGDIRARRTHLLEEISRSESPFLYWIIITMWLLFSFFAFSTAPGWAAEKISQQISTINKQEKIENSKYGLSLKVPINWTVTEEENDKYSCSYTIEPREGSGSITLIGVHYQAEVTYDDMLQFMDSELAIAVPLISDEQAIKPSPAIVQDNKGIEMKFRQFTGDYNTEPVMALLGYGVKGRYGYCLLGMFGEKDKEMGAVVRNTLQSFAIIP